MTSTRLRLAALCAAALVTWLSLDGPIWSATAASRHSPAVSSPVTAWWTTANLGSGVAVPGPLLGASGKQLPVEGSNALPSVSGVSTAPLSSIAVAGVRWRLPVGDVPSSMSLAIAGSAPPFVTVQACQATSSFGAVYGGPYADVPKYSCAHAVDGVVKGGRLTFAGIGKLAAGRTLSVLLVPGPLDRMIFSSPSASSLIVTPARPTRPPPACACGIPSRSGAGNGAATSGVGSGGGGESGPLPAISPAPPQVGPAPSAPAPVVAGSTGGGTQAAALSRTLPRWHRWLAAAVIALEVLVFAATRRSTGRNPNPGRGIGRFIAERDTTPIRL